MPLKPITGTLMPILGASAVFGGLAYACYYPIAEKKVFGGMSRSPIRRLGWGLLGLRS